MFIPQYSLRTLLTIMTGIALCAWVGGCAIRGSQWAVGISFAIIAFVVLALVWGAMFVLVAATGNMVRKGPREGKSSSGTPS